MFNDLKSLYLAWQSPSPRRRWYPVGELEFEHTGLNSGYYCFSYLEGASRAVREAGFRPIDSFPDLDRFYESAELFPLFQNRLMDDRRVDFTRYLDSLALPPEYREPIHILAVTGGRRRTDSYEVFPRIEPASGGHFELTFFLHGTRYFGEAAFEALSQLQPGYPLQLVYEPNNPGTGQPALRVETPFSQPLGYTPNYLVPDFHYIMENCIYKEQLRVERVNMRNSLESRVLLRISGCWPKGYEAMRPLDFQKRRSSMGELAG